MLAPKNAPFIWVITDVCLLMTLGTIGLGATVVLVIANYAHLDVCRKKKFGESCTASAAGGAISFVVGVAVSCIFVVLRHSRLRVYSWFRVPIYTSAHLYSLPLSGVLVDAEMATTSSSTHSSSHSTDHSSPATPSASHKLPAGHAGHTYCTPGALGDQKVSPRDSHPSLIASWQTRTTDLTLTKGTLYQLS